MLGFSILPVVDSNGKGTPGTYTRIPSFLFYVNAWYPVMVCTRSCTLGLYTRGTEQQQVFYPPRGLCVVLTKVINPFRTTVPFGGQTT